ncbi:hypothetical protein LTR56_009346 [Elasticomyces elasticus]|nr:hypothetical protein LTR56_009346 [Elasticomyces elasticus]KAK3666340.1 hypothetical protein LTR22_002644 [Elasticomyces elasticus]KAK4917719.1 hypothetical protein LTR49_014396 [Elasticomyces elasticus]KAK5766280.1 hypothetical protein LTS12_003491 [Elasticomyces elasticus]
MAFWLLLLIAALHAREICASSVSATSNATAASWHAPSLQPQISTSGHGPGYYVAAGLGLSSTDSDGEELSQSSGLATTSHTTSSSLLASFTHSSAFTSSTISANNSTTQPSYLSANGTAQASTAAVTGTGYTFPNATNRPANATGVDACWTQWKDYWAADAGGTFVETGFTFFNTTMAFTNPVTSTVLSSSHTTYTITNTVTQIAMNGPWTETTQTITSKYTPTLTYIPLTTLTTESLFETTMPWFGTGDISTYTVSDAKTPRCRLPSSYSSCQQEWEKWATTSIGLAIGSMPTCSQANITGAICSSLIDSAAKSSGYLYGTTWPTSTTIAPGCNVGCGKCAVTGGTIEVLYFPPGMTPYTDGPVTATTLNTTLTSPTVYISLSKVHANDGCGAVGPTKAATIIPIPIEQLSSSWETVSSHSNGPYDWGCGLNSGIAPFNITNLAYTPVPYSIYESQPYCAELVMAPEGYCSMPCPTTLPYKPIVVVPSSVLNALDPAWATCYLDLRGLYDPPKALTPATAVEGPVMTAPDAYTSIAATPASGPASQTGAANTSPASIPASSTYETPSSGPTDASTAAATSSGLAAAQSTSVTPTQYDEATSRGSTASSADQASVEPSQAEHYAASSQDAGTTSAGSASSTAADPAPQIISILNPSGVQSSASASPDTSPLAASTEVTDPTPQTTSAPSSSETQQPNSAAGSTSIVSTAPGLTSALESTTAEELTSLAPALSILSSALGTYTVQNDPTMASIDLDVSANSAETSATSMPPSSPLISSTSGIIIAGETLLPGATTEINGQQISAGTGFAIVAGSTVLVPSLSTTTVVAGQSYEIAPAENSVATSHASASAVIINSQTFLPGQSGTIGTNFVSAVSGYAVIAGSTIIPPSSPSTTVINGDTYTIQAADPSIPEISDPTAIIIDPSLAISATANQPVVIGTQTVVPGSTALTVSGHTFSATGAQVIVDGTRTIVVGQTNASAFTSVANVDGSAYTISIDPAGQDAVVNSMTISAGGPGAVVEGQTVSLGSSGVQIGSSFLTTGAIDSVAATITTISGQAFTIENNPSGQGVDVNGVALSAGGQPTVVDGQTVSAATNGVDIGGSFINGLSQQATQQTSGESGSTAANTALPSSEVTTPSSSVVSFGVRTTITVGLMVAMAGLTMALAA